MYRRQVEKLHAFMMRHLRSFVHITVVKSYLCFGGVLVRLPNVLQFGECTAGFTESCLDVFLASIVFADETTQVSKVLYKLKWFTIYGNRCGWCGVEKY